MASQWEAESTLFLFKTFWLTKLLLLARGDIQAGFWKCKKCPSRTNTLSVGSFSEQFTQTWSHEPFCSKSSFPGLWLQCSMVPRDVSSNHYSSHSSHTSHTSSVDLDIPNRFIFLACEWSLELSTCCCCFCEAPIIARIKPFLSMFDSDSSLKKFEVDAQLHKKATLPTGKCRDKTLTNQTISHKHPMTLSVSDKQKWFGNTSWVKSIDMYRLWVLGVGYIFLSPQKPLPGYTNWHSSHLNSPQEHWRCLLTCLKGSKGWGVHGFLLVTPTFGNYKEVNIDRTPSKTNSWNLKIDTPFGKGETSTNHQLLGSMLNIRRGKYLPFRNANLTPPSSCPTGGCPLPPGGTSADPTIILATRFGKGNHSQMLLSYGETWQHTCPWTGTIINTIWYGISVYFEDSNLRYV